MLLYRFDTVVVPPLGGCAVLTPHKGGTTIAKLKYAVLKHALILNFEL